MIQPDTTPVNPYAHEGADRLADEVLLRVEGTDWRYVQGYIRNFSRNFSRFQGIIAREDVKPPTFDQKVAGEYPDDYYEVSSHDFESFRIGVLETLNRLGI